MDENEKKKPITKRDDERYYNEKIKIKYVIIIIYVQQKYREQDALLLLREGKAIYLYITIYNFFSREALFLLQLRNIQTTMGTVFIKKCQIKKTLRYFVNMHNRPSDLSRRETDKRSTINTYTSLIIG